MQHSSALNPRFGLNPAAALRGDALRQAGGSTSTMVPLTDLQAVSSTPALSVPVSPAIPTTIPTTMPPPSPSPVEPRPTAPSGPPAPQQQATDPIVSILIQDAAFIAAVKSHDVMKAALAASQLVKENLSQLIARVKPQTQISLASLTTNVVPQALPPPPPVPQPPAAIKPSVNIPGISRRASEADAMSTKVRSDVEGYSLEPALAGAPVSKKDLKTGDKVLIKSSNKTTSPELVGQEALVSKVDNNGWIEVTIPKLANKTVRVQQRYLTLIASAQLPPTPGSTTAAATAATGAKQRVPTAAAPATTLHRTMTMPNAMDVAAEGATGTASDDAGARSHKRMRSPSLVTPTAAAATKLSGGPSDALPSSAPAVLGLLPTPGSGTSKSGAEKLSKAHIKGPQLVGRGVTKMREVVKTIRREVLTLEDLVPWQGVDPRWRVKRAAWRKNVKNAETVCVTAELLRELHEALLIDKSCGPLRHGGVWENTLLECINGQASYPALQSLWQQMQDELKAWTHTLGPGGEKHSQGGTASGAAAPLAPPSTAPGSRPSPNQSLLGPGAGRGSYVAAARAFAALDAVAEKGEALLNQVPLEKMLGANRDSFALLRNLVAREKAAVAAKMQAVSRGEVASMGDLKICMISPADLGGLDAEVDTDLDDGPEATDMEESD